MSNEVKKDIVSNLSTALERVTRMLEEQRRDMDDYVATTCRRKRNCDRFDTGDPKADREVAKRAFLLEHGRGTVDWLSCSQREEFEAWLLTPEVAV